MKLNGKKIIALMLISVALSSQAEFKDGNKLFQQINGNHGEYMNAMGYITGVADTLFGTSTCPPSNVTAGQLIDMVKLYLENYPATRHMSADVIVFRVMSASWPCAKKGNTL